MDHEPPDRVRFLIARTGEAFDEEHELCGAIEDHLRMCLDSFDITDEKSEARFRARMSIDIWLEEV